MKKDKVIINDRQKNINLACDQVNNWSNKVVNKLNIQLGSEYAHMFRGNNDQSMSETFQQITDVVCNKLTHIIKKNEAKKAHDLASGIQRVEGDTGCEELDHQYMDFTTDEFINKNIRVRPTSGITALDKDEQKSDILGRGANLDVGQMDEEEKFNQMANIEMDAQRKTVKVKLEKQ